MAGVAAYLAASLLVVCASGSPPAPEQVHVHVADNSTVTGRYTVMWIHQAPLARVQAARPQLEAASGARAAASCWTYSFGGFAGSVCKAVLTGVPVGGSTTYKVGCDSLGWSAEKTIRSPGVDAVSMLAYADMGVEWSNGTMSSLEKDAASGAYSAVLNHGDMSYADDRPSENNSWVWDLYLNQAEPHLDGSAGPWVVIPGNHEVQGDFAAYLNRTSVHPGAAGSMGPFGYSTAVGPTTVISFSTEHDVSPGSVLYGFLADALEQASAARAERPWIITQSHHPMLCSDLLTWQERCVDQAKQLRRDLEPLFIQHGVDIFFSGHNHMFEASWPYRNGTCSRSLHNANGTVYVVNGGAGDVEGVEPFFLPDDCRMAASSLLLDTTYGRLHVNRTHFRAEFLDSRNGAVVSNFTLSKE